MEKKKIETIGELIKDLKEIEEKHGSQAKVLFSYVEISKNSNDNTTAEIRIYRAINSAGSSKHTVIDLMIDVDLTKKTTSKIRKELETKGNTVL